MRELTLLGQNVNSWGRDLLPEHPHRVRRAAARVRRGRRDRAHPLHEPAPEGLPPPGDRGDGRVRRRLRARAPAAAVGIDADPQGDAPHVLAGALSRARRRDARRRSPTSRSRPTSSSASPARPRTTSCETLAVVEEVRFDSAFTFVYSPRAGTDAAAMTDQIPDEVKRDRIERLVDVVQRIAGERNEERVGRVEEVLVEGPSRTDPTLSARPNAAQHDGQLRRRRAGRRARRRAHRARDLDDARRLAARGRVSSSEASAPSGCAARARPERAAARS